MSPTYLEAPGTLVKPDQLTTPKARQLAYGLVQRQFPFASFVECRVDTGNEVVLLEVEAEVGQTPAHDIRSKERLAIVFHAEDVLMPRVLALRDDFPLVPHLNIELEVLPRSLCLFNETYAELKLRLTVRGLVERIREWLRLTARGELHAPDQALEQFLIAPAGTIILPHSLVPLASAVPPPGFREELEPLTLATSGAEGFVLVARRGKESDQVNAMMGTFIAKPRGHGPIQRMPRTLSDLHELLAPGGDDLIGAMREHLWKWKQSGQLQVRFTLLLLIPLRRTSDGPIERFDRWAFLTKTTLLQLGEEVGVWAKQDGQPGMLLTPDDTRRGGDVQLLPCDVTLTLSRRRAALLNGYSEDTSNIVLVGCGALGSQVFLNLFRSGFGKWVLVDKDNLMPHNLARHALTAMVGEAKAPTLATWVADVFDEPPAARAIVADVLAPGEQAGAVDEALGQAQLIIDMSTSIAVARVLARDSQSAARRVSLFLTPRGNDLVMLMEDTERVIGLDALEMQYYRVILENDELADHLAPPEDPIRYGKTCRDVTFRLSQDSAALFAAIGSRGLRTAFGQARATITIWRAREEPQAVTVLTCDTHPAFALKHDDWTAIIDEGLLQKLAAMRQSRLPNETGGVLLGSLDLQRKIVYIAHALPSPPDSQEYPTCYVRGSKGLLSAVKRCVERTSGQLHYVGEWHSHPDGCAVDPSSDDRKVFGWIHEEVEPAGYPAVMLIAGEVEIAVFLGTLSSRSSIRLFQPGSTSGSEIRNSSTA